MQFPWKLRNRSNITCSKSFAVSGKFSSLHKSQLLFSLQCKHRPNIFCHIKDTNGHFYFLSGTNVHRRFRSCSKISDTYLSINPKQILEKKKKKNNFGFLFTCSFQKVKTTYKTSPVYMQHYRLEDSQSIGRCAQH